MNRRWSVVAVVLLLALAGAGAGALLGVGPFADSDDAESAPAPPDDAGTATPADGTYEVTLGSIESCGTTCREVTATLRNRNGPRRNVSVTTAIYADGDWLWSDEESVGRLDAGASYTTTKRVAVGLTGGLKIRSNDGYVTLVTVVRSDDGTERFTERRRVA